MILSKLPKYIWWKIFSYIPKMDIFKSQEDNAFKQASSFFRQIIESPEFMTWIMCENNRFSEAYPIDLNYDHLRPQNTFRIRKVEFEKDNVFYKYPFLKESCNGSYTKKEEFAWFQERLEQDQYDPTVRYPYTDLCRRRIDKCIHKKIIEDDVKSHYRLNSPIENQNIVNNNHPFNHASWGTKSISNNLQFKVSSQTNDILKTLIYDENGVPTNFPKPQSTKLNGDYPMNLNKTTLNEGPYIYDDINVKSLIEENNVDIGEYDYKLLGVSSILIA